MQWHYPFSEKLINSLNRLPNFQGKLFRGCSKYNFNYATGEIVEWNCFSSTSKEFESANKFFTGLIKSSKNHALGADLNYIF